MAKLLRDSAWVREAVKLAWQLGVAQPALDVAKLNADSISDAHLEGLYAFFVRGASAEVAGNIANGKAPALPDEAPEALPPPTSAVGKLTAKLKSAAKRVGAVMQRIQLAAYTLVNPDAAVHHVESPEAARRGMAWMRIGALGSNTKHSAMLHLASMYCVSSLVVSSLTGF